MGKGKFKSFSFRLIKKFLGGNRSYDLDSEIGWWKHHFDNHFTIANFIQRENAFPSPLLPFIHDLQQRNKRKPRLLEIGPGPASLLAWGAEENLFEITAVDPLAKEYEQLLAKYGLEYPVKPVKGYAEFLLELFSPESFDIVYSSNALDHSRSPKKCLENISLIVKRGGIVYLEGFCREGTNEQWTGLHQHDLLPEKGHLLHFNKKGQCTNLTQNLKLRCVFERVQPFYERGIDAFGYESEDLEKISDWHYRDWYTMIFLSVV